MPSCVPAFICSVAIEANCLKESSPQLNMVNSTQKKIGKLVDAFEEKTVREMDKIIKCFEKVDKVKQEVSKRTETIENSFRQLRRQMAKLHEAGDDSCSAEADSANEEEEEKFYPPELYRPVQFVTDYIISDENIRKPFSLHYLEARFGDHYRADRYGAFWKKSSRRGKYVKCKFEEILEWLNPEKTVMFQFKECLAPPPSYLDEKKEPEIFGRMKKWWPEDDKDLDRPVLKKFLCQKHQSLPSIRSY
jgi:hypothetical protein